MEYCSYFIEKKCLFGSYPSQSTVRELEIHGVRYFLDLTQKNEKGTQKYDTKYNYENYPIFDRSPPSDRVSFGQLLIRYGKIINHLPEGNLLYIHCRGGHGRSGVVVAALLVWIYKISPTEALLKTSIYHSIRENLSEKRRKIGSPQTRSQKNFILSYFKPLYLVKKSTPCLANILNDTDFSNFSPIDRYYTVKERIENNQEIMEELFESGMTKLIIVPLEPQNRQLATELLHNIRIDLLYKDSVLKRINISN